MVQWTQEWFLFIFLSSFSLFLNLLFPLFIYFFFRTGTGREIDDASQIAQVCLEQ